MRRSDIDGAAGAVEEVARIVGQIRARWPRVRLLLRADSGFCREALMAWCEANRVDYVFGLVRNPRLTAEIETEMAAARAEAEKTGKPARRFKDFRWSTLDSWSRIRRVIGKAEWTEGEANPRFIVTTLTAAEIDARRLYERIYCARGEMEIWPSWCVSKMIEGGGMTDTMVAATMQAFKHGFVDLDEPDPLGPHRQLAGDNDATLDPAMDCIAGGRQANRQLIDGPLPWLTRAQPVGHGPVGGDRHANPMQQITDHRRGIGRPPLRWPPSFRIQGCGDRRGFMAFGVQFADPCQQGGVVAQLRQTRHRPAQVMVCPHTTGPVAGDKDRFALTLDGDHDALQHQPRDRLPIDSRRTRRCPECGDV
ncbi:MAG: transposase [Rhodopila sp.]